MDEQITRSIGAVRSFKALITLRENIRTRGALTDSVQQAVLARAMEFGREKIRTETGIDLVALSPASEKIVQAVAEYVALKELKGSNANRTLSQIANRGLIGAAEISVTKSVPTEGYRSLTDEGREDLSYERIILEHPEEFSDRALWYAKRTLGVPNSTTRPPKDAGISLVTRSVAVLQWLRNRRDTEGQIAPFDNKEVVSDLGWGRLQAQARTLGGVQSRIDLACFRAGLPPLGLVSKTSFGNAWNQEGRSWAFPRADMQAAARSRAWSDDDFDALAATMAHLPAAAHLGWRKALAENEAEVMAWAYANTAEAPVLITGAMSAQPNYWVFVCNPKKWAIDRFLESGADVDSWGVRPSDKSRFGPGQLGIVRVGSDSRTAAELDGRPRLEAGIYALCEVETTAYPATGASDEFWLQGQGRGAGWPTVRLKYLKRYSKNPLTIARLRAEAPNLSSLLLNGFQAASFPISGEDFHRVMSLLGVELDAMDTAGDEKASSAEELSAIEKKYLNASPEVKERISKGVERGPVGAAVKRANGYRCQVCQGLGREPIGFIKRDGTPYVEAHHVSPVSLRQIGSLAASNILTVCANHHRQIHYADIPVRITPDSFEILIDGSVLDIPRPTI